MSTHNLERVRRIKSRMVRLTTRVETIREFLQKFLDDDSDMHDMNLTARQQDMLERQTSLIRNSLARNSLTGKSALLRCWWCRDASLPHTPNATGAGQEADIPHTPYKGDSDSEEEEEEIAAVEMILETYFMHVDNTYNKLQTLCESLHPFRG